MCAVPSCTTCVTAAASRHVSRKSCLRVSTRLQPPPPHKAQARPHKPLQRLPVAAFCFLACSPPPSFGPFFQSCCLVGDRSFVQPARLLPPPCSGGGGGCAPACGAGSGADRCSAAG